MKIKNKNMSGVITLMTLALIFFASPDVQESVSKSTYQEDQLWGVVDSLQKELAVYREREVLLLKHLRDEVCTATAYLPVDSIEGRYSGLTETGAVATPHVTLAVDPEEIPINCWIWINDLGWWKAEDTGNTIRGKKIDLCVSNRKEAMEFGVRKMRIKILK